VREASPGITEVGRTLIIYAACRAVIIAVVILFPSDVSAAGRFEAFDGSYYANIVQHGYPEVLPIAGQSVIGFFPGYPLVVRAVDGIFRIPTWLGLVSVSLVAGAVATVLMVLIAKELGYASASKGPGVLW
jgi:hypothetical protein